METLFKKKNKERQVNFQIVILKQKLKFIGIY